MVLVGSFGLSAKLGYGFPVWMMIKMVCWLGICVLSGAAYRKPEKAKSLIPMVALLVLIAVAMVYVKPFLSEAIATEETGSEQIE